LRLCSRDQNFMKTFIDLCIDARRGGWGVRGVWNSTPRQFFEKLVNKTQNRWTPRQFFLKPLTPQGFSTHVHLWTYDHLTEVSNDNLVTRSKLFEAFYGLSTIWPGWNWHLGHKLKTFLSGFWSFDLLLVTRSKNSISWKMTQKQFRYPDHESLVDYPRHGSDT
jgi:hypothetical protein